MVVSGTHVWVWWTSGDPALPAALHRFLDSTPAQDEGLGVSAISCWEVAKLVALGRLDLGGPAGWWLASALGYPGVRFLPLSPAVAVEANQLPGSIHRDPADQIIVVTTRLFGCPLLTADAKI